MGGSSSAPYSPKCVEGVFCEVELPLYGVLRSSSSGHSAKFAYMEFYEVRLPMAKATVQAYKRKPKQKN
jgi:hypothetical protein